MHEGTTAREIIKAAKAYGKVKSIVVEVGELSHVALAELNKHIKKKVKWKVSCVKGPSKVVCADFIGTPKIKHEGYFCPVCNSVPKVIEGGDVLLKDVQVK